MTTEIPRDWIDLYWSGELEPEASERVEAYLECHPETWQRLALTEKLRQRVGVVMKARCPEAPADLAEALRARLARALEVEGEAVIGRVDERGIVEHDEVMEPQSAPVAIEARSAAWWRRHRWIGVAAAVALVAGAVLIGIFGQRIDARTSIPAAHRVVEAATKVAGEHGMLTSDRRLLVSTLTFHSPEQASHGLSVELGVPVRIADLSGLGYSFVGAGVCKVPHCLNACHVVYQHREHGDLLVFHVVADDGRLVLDPDARLEALPHGGRIFAADASRPVDVVAWSDGAVLYLLTADDLAVAREIVETVQARTS